MEQGEKKVVLEKHIDCPICKTKLVVKHTKTLLNNPQTAEWGEETTVEKDTQKKLIT